MYHVFDENQRGIFSFAIGTVAPQILMIAYYGIRPIHITDTLYKYSFGEYLNLKIFTCIFALICCITYLFLKPNDSLKTTIILLVSIYRIIDGFADVYEAEFQRQGYLYLAGMSCTFRTVISLIVFVITLFFYRNLVISCFCIIISAMIGVIFFNVRYTMHISTINYKRNISNSLILMRKGILLFIAAFLDLYIFNATKFIIDNHLTNSDSAIYGAIFMPTSIIALLSGFLIRPLLSDLAEKWNLRKYKTFGIEIVKLSIIISLLTCIVLCGTNFVGIRILKVIFNEDFFLYRKSLLVIIIGGGFYSLSSVFYYVLIIMNCQNYIFIAYALCCLILYPLSNHLVFVWGIWGGAMAYCISCFLLMLFQILLVLFLYPKKSMVDTF